jgi:DNA-binding CsgD family transcriptional regulator/tetratricopeptide (TPR) repeat protein
MGTAAAHHRLVARRVSSDRFIGRADDLGRLTAAYAQAAAGRSLFVLVTGEAGVGKSRLLAEARRGFEAAGATVLVGGCIQLGDELPFGPVAEALRPLVATQGRDRVLALAGPHRLALERLIPELTPTPERLPDEHASGAWRLYEAVRTLLTTMTRDGPVVLAIEDVHWADASTRALLQYLLGTLDDSPILVVATYRSDEVSGRHPLLPVLAELGRSGDIERLDLEPFGRTDLGDLATSILDHPLDGRDLDTLVERSDGNPFLAEELMAASAAGMGRQEIPTTLADVLAARLAGLSPDARRIVRAASVLGRRVDHRLLTRILPDPEVHVLACLREAVDERILVPADAGASVAYAFRHALVGEAAYDELLPAERVALHGAVAQALQAETADDELPAEVAGEIAYHAFRAHDLPRALVTAIQAAVAATAIYAYPEALRQYERAIECWPDVPDAGSLTGLERWELLFRAARSAAAAHDPARGCRIAEAALEALGPGRELEAGAIVAQSFWFAWEAADYEALERFGSAGVALVPAETPGDLRAQVLANLAALRRYHGHHEEALVLGREAVTAARQARARGAEGRALAVVAETLSHLGRPDAALVAFGEAAEAAADAGDREELVRIAHGSTWAHEIAGRFDQGLKIAEQALEASVAAGSESRHGDFLRAVIIECLVELGRWQEVDELIRRVDERWIASPATAWAEVMVMRIHISRGEFAEAIRIHDRTVDIPAIAFNLVWETEEGSHLAYAEDRVGEARRIVDTAIAACPTPHDSALWWILSKAVTGEADAASDARARRRKQEVDAAIGFGTRYGDLLRHSLGLAIATGEAGPLAEAYLVWETAERSRLVDRADPAAWDRAASTREALPQPYEAAYARFRHAEAILAAAGSRDAAERALRTAHATAAVLEAKPLLRRIEELARRARLSVTARRPAGRVRGRSTELTPREREVVAYLAEGRTNREIAEALFVSERTASVHVSNLMGKLDARSRFEAAAIATRRGLLAGPSDEPGAPVP